jgi:hypothetical protein
VNAVETIRGRFLPEQIATLFVDESAPSSGVFFYFETGQVYRCMKRVFSRDQNCDQNFLSDFKANGYFLDDLILIPNIEINNSVRYASVQSLAERMVKYQPKAVVALMKAIEPMVRQAMKIANLSSCPFYATRFPGNGHCTTFRAEMAEILPQLPKAMVLKKL